MTTIISISLFCGCLIFFVLLKLFSSNKDISIPVLLALSVAVVIDFEFLESATRNIILISCFTLTGLKMILDKGLTFTAKHGDSSISVSKNEDENQ